MAFILLTSIHFAAGASSGLLPPSDQRPKKKRSLIFSLHHQTTVGVTFSKSTVHYSQNLAPYKCQRVKEAYALEIQNSEHKGLIYTDASRCQWSAEEKWSSTLLRDPQHICSRWWQHVVQHVLIHIWEMMNCFKGNIVMGLQQYCSGGSLVFRVIKLMHHWLKWGVKSILLTEFSKTELAPVLPLIMFLKWIFSHIMMLFCGAIILFCVFWY